MKKEIVILGAGGCAKEVFGICKACGKEVIGFAEENAKPHNTLYGLPIFSIDELKKKPKSSVLLLSGIGSPAKERLVKLLEQHGFGYAIAVHPSAIIAENAKIGKGTVIGAGTIIESDVVVGKHVLVNMACTIAHDCIIEDFATISPGANISGNVFIGQGAFIGTGCSIIEKKKIGESAIVGAAACVVEDVPARALVFGVPARVKRLLKEGETWSPES